MGERIEKLTLSVSELAEVLGIGRNVAYELVNAKGFPAIRLGERRIVIPMDGLRRWLDQQTQEVTTDG